MCEYMISVEVTQLLWLISSGHAFKSSLTLKLFSSFYEFTHRLSFTHSQIVHHAILYGPWSEI